jgi:hypothetical protein
LSYLRHFIFNQETFPSSKFSFTTGWCSGLSISLWIRRSWVQFLARVWHFPHHHFILSPTHKLLVAYASIIITKKIQFSIILLESSVKFTILFNKNSSTLYALAVFFFLDDMAIQKTFSQSIIE